MINAEMVRQAIKNESVKPNVHAKIYNILKKQKPVFGGLKNTTNNNVSDPEYGMYRSKS